MSKRTHWVVGGMIVVVTVAIAAIFILTIRPLTQPTLLPTPIAETEGTPTAVQISVDEPMALAETVDRQEQVAALQNQLQRLIEERQARPRSPQTAPLPEISPPPDGQIYELSPMAPQFVGWFGLAEGSSNQLGDFNIYAGAFEGEPYTGAIQFDLSSIPPGSPIIHADLTLTGLSDEWLRQGGAWTVELLAPWMDTGWVEQNGYWFTRAESGIATLTPVLTSEDLGVGQPNHLFFTPEALPLLEARLFSGQVSFRVMGPPPTEDNLFAWDSGYGSGSRGLGPRLRIVAGPPPDDAPPTPTPVYTIITPVPDILALAAERMTATAQATPYVGEDPPTPTPTPTPFPPDWVTPVILVPTQTPENQATALWEAQVATAQAVVFGTPTPWPANVWTATPPPPPPPPPLWVSANALTPTPTATSTPRAILSALRGKIMFYSDRTGTNQLMFMNPDGSNVNVWQRDAWVYQQARQQGSFAPDGSSRVIVSREQVSVEQLFIQSLADATMRQLTHFNDLSYDPVWSPRANTIAFVSPVEDGDEIYTINADGTGLQRLTVNTWEWDKHPTWSPDGSQIVFWSNRDTSRRQIWVMNADGSNQRNLSNNPYNDWDPVWIK